MTADERITRMTEVARAASAMARDGTPAARAADFLYGDDGMPA